MRIPCLWDSTLKKQLFQDTAVLFTSEILICSSLRLPWKELSSLWVTNSRGKSSFFPELELDNAKVEGGLSNNAEISMKRAFLKFNLNEEDIPWHDGEAAKSKKAFTSLSVQERNQLMKFLNSL
jgi:hypothetical protein